MLLGRSRFFFYAAMLLSLKCIRIIWCSAVGGRNSKRLHISFDISTTHPWLIHAKWVWLKCLPHWIQMRKKYVECIVHVYCIYAQSMNTRHRLPSNKIYFKAYERNNGYIYLMYFKQIRLHNTVFKVLFFIKPNVNKNFNSLSIAILEFISFFVI